MITISVFSILGFIAGTVLGSLAKALADRSLSDITFWGRSTCPNCQKKLNWYDLIPLVSYLILSGKCRYCQKTIGKEYFLVEVISGILIGFLFWSSSSILFKDNPLLLLQAALDLFLKIFFITVLISLALTDIRKNLIPDRISLPAIVITSVGIGTVYLTKILYLYFSLSQNQLGKYLLPPYNDYFQRHAILTLQPFFTSLLMGFLIAGFFMLLIVITAGRGMGGGDVKLGGLIGVSLGFPYSLVALVLSFVSGALFSVGLILLKRKHFGQTIPFGPFLVIGSLVALFWGPQIVNWYLHLSF